MSPINIPTPSSTQIDSYLKEWDTLENYVSQESSLRKLFIETYPENKELDDVLIKVCSLNDFYSTNIFSPFSIAKHIIFLDIDDRLKANDLTLVNDIASTTIKDKKINFYSFATKYCSHHRPEAYPIFDNFVERLLMHFKKKDQFSVFKKEDMRTYQRYVSILNDFKKFYGVQEYTMKEIDKYLWQAGKDYFPKRYK